MRAQSCTSLIGLQLSLLGQSGHVYAQVSMPLCACVNRLLLFTGLSNAIEGDGQQRGEMAAELQPFGNDMLLNAIGGCSGPEHIATIRKLVQDKGFKPRKKHGVLLMFHIQPTEYIVRSLCQYA
jgi:hypothetical protein